MTETFAVKGQNWFDKTISIDEGIEKITDERRTRQDIMCTLKHMVPILNQDGQIAMEHLDGREFVPTEHAIKQMATWMHVPHGFLNAMRRPVYKQNGQVKFDRDARDNEILLNVFKNGIRDGRVDPEKEFRFRTYTDGTLRAMLSDIYGIIDNTWYLETIRESFKQIGSDEPRLMKWLGDADTIYSNLLLPDSVTIDIDHDGDPSDYAGMISIGNCEIGKRRMSLIPSVFRGLCTNGMIFGQQIGIMYSRVHRGNVDLGDLRTTILSNLSKQIPRLTDGIERLLSTKDKQFETDIHPGKMIAQIVLENNLTQGSKGQSAAIAVEFDTHEKSNRNLFGLINAVTRAAQTQLNEDWVKMDGVGGKLAYLNDTGWDGLKARAKAMEMDAMRKVYGIVATAT